MIWFFANHLCFLLNIFFRFQWWNNIVFLPTTLSIYPSLAYGSTYKYLYDPNSPLRNEDCYNAFVRRLAGYEGISPEMKKKYEYDARMTSLNRTGTVAADFRFADKKGRMHTLHGIKAPLTLLFFSNPGCDACLNIINVLKGEPQISGLIDSGRLAVLNIYIDEDLQGWRLPIYCFLKRTCWWRS